MKKISFFSLFLTLVLFIGFFSGYFVKPVHGGLGSTLNCCENCDDYCACNKRDGIVNGGCTTEACRSSGSCTGAGSKCCWANLKV